MLSKSQTTSAMCCCFRFISATITKKWKFRLFLCPVGKTARTWFLYSREAIRLQCSTFKFEGKVHSEILSQAPGFECLISAGHHFLTEADHSWITSPFQRIIHVSPPISILHPKFGHTIQNCMGSMQALLPFHSSFIFPMKSLLTG